MRAAIRINLPEIPEECEMFIISDEYTDRTYGRDPLDICLWDLADKVKTYADEVVGGKFRSSNTTEDLMDSLKILFKAYNKRQAFIKEEIV